MRKQCIAVMAAALIMGPWQSVGAEEFTPSSIHTPEILKVEIDAVKRRLIISGANFLPGSAAVRLGSEALSVTSASSSRIVAALPPVLSPATYRLTLFELADISKSDTFDLPLFGLYRNTPRGH